jgi:hypothetical protein
MEKSNFFKSMLHSLFGILTPQAASTTPIEDPTVYMIETSIKKYCGRIIYQDDVLLKLKGFKPKPVKILKSNIIKIKLVENESSKNYYEWHSARQASLNSNFNKYSMQA